MSIINVIDKKLSESILLLLFILLMSRVREFGDLRQSR
jgi:hypothetical protein